MFTVKNATIVALMQVGVIFAGIAASGLWHKVVAAQGIPMPFLAGWLYNYGVFVFLIPLAWVSGAMWLYVRAEISEEIKNLAFWLGVLILIGLIGFMICVNVLPCFRMQWVVNGAVDA